MISPPRRPFKPSSISSLHCCGIGMGGHNRGGGSLRFGSRCRWLANGVGYAMQVGLFRRLRCRCRCRCCCCCRRRRRRAAATTRVMLLLLLLLLSVPIPTPRSLFGLQLPDLSLLSKTAQGYPPHPHPRWFVSVCLSSMLFSHSGRGDSNRLRYLE